MTKPANLPIAESLILARLLPAGEKGESIAKIGVDLKPLLGGKNPADSVTDLKTKGLIEDLPSKGKGKKPTGKVILTEEGRAAALGFLGIGELPPKATWAAIRKSYFPLLALGLPATGATINKLAKDTAFKPALLKHLHALPLGDTPTLVEATNALTWKLLGLESDEKLSVAAIQKALFHRAIGDPGGKPIDPKKAVDHLVAKGLGATSADPKKFRDAAILRWIDSQAAPAPVAAESTPPPFVMDLPAFADRVKGAAAACKTGRFGDNKVFVVHVWRSLMDDPEFRGLDLAAFKEKLAEANNHRLLDLARADLAPAMDLEDVRLSEIRRANATFHFILI